MLISTRAHTHTHTVSYIVCMQCCCSLQTKLLLLYRVGEGFIKYMYTIFTERTVRMKNDQSYVPLRRKDVF